MSNLDLVMLLIQYTIYRSDSILGPKYLFGFSEFYSKN